MKKFKRIGYIVLIVIIAVLVLAIYTNASKGTEESEKQKAFTEIKYIESKLVEIFNEVNKVESRNYNIQTSEISKEATEESSSESSSSSSGGGEGKGESSGGENQEITDSQDLKKYELQISGALTSKEDINWSLIQGEVENLYTSIATITIDLYQLGINQDDILNFNNQLDQVAIAVKDENKEETLAQMSSLYNNLTTITKKIPDEELYKVLVETKSNIFMGYSKLDSRKLGRNIKRY